MLDMSHYNTCNTPVTCICTSQTPFTTIIAEVKGFLSAGMPGASVQQLFLGQEGEQAACALPEFYRPKESLAEPSQYTSLTRTSILFSQKHRKRSKKPDQEATPRAQMPTHKEILNE